MCKTPGTSDSILKSFVWGSFCRSFDLSAVDADRICAAYSDGVLTLTLPKKEERRSSSRKLEIQ